MKTRLLNWILLATVASAFSAACGDDDDSSGATGGAHQGGKTNTGGAGRGGGGHGGAQAGETSSGGVGEGGATISQGGSTVVPEGGASGASPSGGTNPGTGGTNTGGTTTASGGTNAGGTTTANGGTTTASGGTNSGGTGTGGIMMTGGAGGAEGGSGGNAAGAGGEGGVALDPVAQRGQYLVVTVAQCSSCHTDPTKATMFLGGNPNFTSGVKIPAPNLTPDVTGLGDWTDEEIKRAIRDGIDDEGRQLAPAMPYWLYHNLTDADADAIVAYLRTIPKISNAVGTTNPAATAVTPLSPSAFPSTSLTSGDEFESAQHGKYLLTSVARCVGCHSVSTGGVPAPAFSGRPPATAGLVYPVNLTPDATGLNGWTADDVATTLLTHISKSTHAQLCRGMPNFSGLAPADALAIGRYLTTIPAVENTAASLATLPACP